MGSCDDFLLKSLHVSTSGEQVGEGAAKVQRQWHYDLLLLLYCPRQRIASQTKSR